MEHISTHRSNYTNNWRSPQLSWFLLLFAALRRYSEVVQFKGECKNHWPMAMRNSNKHHPRWMCHKADENSARLHFLNRSLNQPCLYIKVCMMSSEAFRRPDLVIAARWRKLCSVGSCFSPKGWSSGPVSKHTNTHKQKQLKCTS